MISLWTGSQSCCFYKFVSQPNLNLDQNFPPIPQTLITASKSLNYGIELWEVFSRTESALQKRAILLAVDICALVNNTLSVAAPHVIVRHRNEMDVANTSEWIGSASTMEESISTARKGWFASGELAYDEAQSVEDCSAPSKGQKNLQVR